MNGTLAVLLVVVALLGTASWRMAGWLGFGGQRGRAAGRRTGAGHGWGAVLVGAGKAAVLLGRSAARGVGSLGGAERILGPGAKSPENGGGDVRDYRGVAREGELRGLRGDGIRLGRYLKPGGRTGGELRLPPEVLHRNCVILGPPGSGKTQGFVLPWIEDLLTMGQSVVTVDVKGDLYDQLVPVAARTGARLWYWSASGDARSQSWNWLAGIVDHRDIEACTRAILGKPKPNDSQPFFYERDYRWLRALIGITLAIYGRHAKPRDLYDLVGNQVELLDAFHQYPATCAFLAEVRDLVQVPPDEHSRAVSGLLNALHLFNLPEVVAVTERNDFALVGIGRQPTLLVVGASLADARASEVLSSILLNLLFTFVYRRFSPGGSRTPLPLFFLIDEAGRLKDRIAYDEVLSVSRSARVGICLATQDITQFGDERQAMTVLANCLTLITLRGCSPETARAVAQRLGHRVDHELTMARQVFPWTLLPQESRQVRAQNVPVLREREIMHPPGPAFAAVVQVGPVSPKPFLIDVTLPRRG